MSRQYDLSMFAGVGQPVATRLTPAMPDAAGGLVCTGAIKLAQRYLTEFLLDLGSIPDDPLRGNRLMRSLRGGRIQSITDLNVAFALANAATIRQLTVETLATDPPDEILTSATLANASVGGGFVQLEIVLETAMGSNVTAILPLPVPPGR